MTKIEWTGKTWNPIVGCSIVSPGCTNCYAMKMAARLEAMGDAAVKACKAVPAAHYAGTTKWVNGKPGWTGKVALAPDDILTKPLRTRKPTTWFVNSMGDLFHEDVPDEWIDRVFAVMAICPQHTFQVLTKRSKRMREYCASATTPDRVVDALMLLMAQPRAFRRTTGQNAHWWPILNVWLGVSAEDQRRANERIPDLLETPAAVRFVSAEPLLGSIDFTRRVAHPAGDRLSSRTWMKDVNWIIVGGESGPGARPMHPDWARTIRDQCQAAGVPYFFKQWGNWLPMGPEDEWGREWMLLDPSGVIDVPDYRCPDFEMGEYPVVNVGKARAGRLLDGREWNEMPGASSYDQSPTDPHHGGKIWTEVAP